MLLTLPLLLLILLLSLSINYYCMLATWLLLSYLLSASRAQALFLSLPPLLPQLLSSKISAAVVDTIAFNIAYVGDGGDGLSASNYRYFWWRYWFCSSVVFASNARLGCGCRYRAIETNVAYS
jgi:hypothetical protein